MTISFSETGIVVDTQEQIRDQMAANAKVNLAAFLGQTELKTDDSSVIGRHLATVARPAAQNAELLQPILDQFDLNKAQGVQLDNILWRIHRIKRKGLSQAEGLLMLFGDVGTVVSEGSEVSNSKTGDVYSINNDVTFNENDCNGIEIVISSVGGTYTINYSVNGFLSESPSVVVTTGSADTTIQNIADRIVDAVNSQTSYLTASRNNDNSIKIIITDQNNTGDFSVTGSISIVRAYKPVYATSQTYQAAESNAGDVSVVRTTVLGWRGVTNPFVIAASQGVEEDPDYRYRGNLIKGNTNTSSRNSLLGRIEAVRGVSFLNIQANNTPNPTGSGIINNGLAITVQGGNEDDIAIAIADAIADGIETSGTITKITKDKNGGDKIVRFSRPQVVPLKISMSITIAPNFPTNGKNLIKQAIVDWFNSLKVGDDIYYSRLYEPINSISGFSVRNLQIGKLDGSYVTDDIVLGHNEVATISAENIFIGGS